MAFLPKKTMQSMDGASETDTPAHRKPVKNDKHFSPVSKLAAENAHEMITEDIDAILDHDPMPNSRIRLSADILKETYVQLKCYSIIKNETIVSILTRLIDTHCSVKVSL